MVHRQRSTNRPHAVGEPSRMPTNSRPPARTTPPARQTSSPGRPCQRRCHASYVWPIRPQLPTATHFVAVRAPPAAYKANTGDPPSCLKYLAGRASLRSRADRPAQTREGQGGPPRQRDAARSGVLGLSDRTALTRPLRMNASFGRMA